MKLNTFTGAIAAPFLMALITGVTASAQQLDDNKIYSANMCTPTVYNTSKGLVVNPQGGLLNWDTANPLRVVCPIVADQYMDRGLYVFMYGLDQHATEDIQCKIQAVSVDGNIQDYYSFKSSGSSNQVQYMAGGKDFLKGSTSFVLQCQIPPMHAGGPSGFVSYRVVETVPMTNVTKPHAGGEAP